MTEPQPILSVCTPTRDRADLLRRSLGSIAGQVVPPGAIVELVVSDNSTDDASEAVARPVLAAWPGPTRYARNDPPVGLVENHNRCLELATGRYVSFLHDDDYLVPGALAAVIEELSAPGGPAVHLFGVDVVDLAGRRRRSQCPHRDELLPPPDALRRLLTSSSYVRIPGLVASAEAYRAVGAFDPGAANAMDFEMWVRLFARFGVHRVPRTVASYTVHEAALTSAMFTPPTISLLFRIFDRAAALGVLDQATVRRCQATWFHQFILAGTYRFLERRDRAGAAAIMALFGLPAVRQLGLSLRWLPARLAFGLLTLGAGQRSPASPVVGDGP
jgi:glycosyltransferase involved in cell wall biosynthesis